MGSFGGHENCARPFCSVLFCSVRATVLRAVLFCSRQFRTGVSRASSPLCKCGTHHGRILHRCRLCELQRRKEGA